MAAPRNQMSNENPNAIAFSRMNSVRPVWTGMRRLSSLPGLSSRIILHAGPKFRDFSSIPVPVRNSLISIILREKWAENVESAEMLLQDGSISVEPAQEYNVYVPLAGAAGPSTMLIEVRDEAGDGAAYSPLNEGMELCTRLGILHPDLPAHLEWLDGVLAPWIDGLLTERPLPLGPVLREAIAQQDDCHSCTVAGSRLLAAALLDRDGGRSNTSAIEAFLDGAPAFALNVWMAMCGLVARAAAGVPGSTLVVNAGGNGVQFGFRLAGDASRWHVNPAPRIHGTVEPRFAGAEGLPALGDSAIVDVMGLGGQLLDQAVPVREALAAHLPAGITERPRKFLSGTLDLFGRLAATDCSAVLGSSIGPVILLGMIDRLGERGRVGGGCVVTTGADWAPGYAR